MDFKPSDLFNAVCFFTSTDPDSGGNGVFLRPDVIFTAAHVISNPETMFVHNTQGYVATIVPGSMVVDKTHDIAIANLNVPLFDRDVPLVTEDSLLGTKGYLLTRFNIHHFPIPEVSVYETHFDPEFDALDQRYRDTEEYLTYKTNANVRAGYSGSPIFNAKGEVSSVVSSAKKRYGDNEPRDVPLHPEGYFFLPDSRAVARFLQKNLG